MPLPADGPVTAGDLLTLEALGHFRRTSTLRGVGLVLHAWGVIAGAIALYLLWSSAPASSGSWCSCTRPRTGCSSARGA
jgi:hypothetical protein